jgi:hypothetical protein
MNFPEKQDIFFNLFATGIALLIASTVAGFILLVVVGIFAIIPGTDSININKVINIIIHLTLFALPLTGGIVSFIYAY